MTEAISRMADGRPREAGTPPTRVSPPSLAWFLRALSMLLAVATVCFAQLLIDRRHWLIWAVAASAIGSLVLALSCHHVTVERPVSAQGDKLTVHRQFLRWVPVFAALALLGLSDNKISFYGLIAWILAILLCFIGLPGCGRSASRQEGKKSTLTALLGARQWRVSWTAWGLALAIALGAVRFYRLLEIPADLGWDLPYNYTDAQRVLRGQYLVFFPDNYGREGMFFYVIAAVAKMMPLSPYSIRIASAIVGMVSIPAIYLLGRECVDSEAGVYAALMLALNKWHLVLTRSGYRVSLMPLFTILAVYGLARALRRGQSCDWAWCGLFLGLGLWTYKAFTFVPPIAIGCVIVYALLGRFAARRCAGLSATGGETNDSSASPVTPRPRVSSAERRGSEWTQRPKLIIEGVIILLVVMAVAAIPMIRFVVDHPETYLAREKLGLGFIQADLERGQITRAQLYWKSLTTSLLMFHYEGDPNTRFGVPFQRHLGLIGAALFSLGVVAALTRLRRGANALLVLCVLGLLAPMVVSMRLGEKPNCFRSSGVIGPSIVLMAMVLRILRLHVTQAIAWVEGLRSRRRDVGPASGHSPVALCVAFAIVTLVISLEGRETLGFYFGDLRAVLPDQANWSIAQEMSEVILDYQDGPAYVKTWAHWYDGNALKEYLHSSGRVWDGELPEMRPDAPPLSNFRGDMLVILHPSDVQSLEMLKRAFPRWTVKTKSFPVSKDPIIIAFYGEI